jgi:chromosome partitioning protein
MITVVGNLKGGSGKSTVTFNIAVWLAVADQQVVAYDLDPQCTLSDVAEVRNEEGYMPPVTVFRARAGDVQERLLSHRGEVLADVGASDIAAMKRALGLANRILVPVCPSQADIWSTQRFMNIVVNSISKEGDIPEIIGFINRADTHISVRETEEAEYVLSKMPYLQVLKTRLGQRTSYRRSFSEGLGVFELEPNGKAAFEFITLAERLYPGFAY